MKKYSVEVVATAALAAILIQPTLAFAQDRAPDTVAFSIEAGSGVLVTNEFIHRKNALTGEALIPLFETQSALPENAAPQCTRTSPSASTLKLQSVAANEKALEARIKERLAAENTPAVNGTVIRLGNGELFEADSEKLSVQGQETLRNVAAIINRHASPEVRVVVNADPELVEKRADTIRNYLAQFSKITVNQVRIVRAIEGISPEESRYTTSIQLVDRL